MAGNNVTLTFAGDSTRLEQAFERVGESARTMDRDVGSAASGFDRASEASDIAEGRFQGFASTLTGTADIAAGFGDVAKGNVFEGLVGIGGGAADLAEGFNYTLIPAMQSAVTWLGNTKVGTLATAAAQRVAAAGARVWAAAQWLMNTALLASPITWIVLGILLLVGVIILIATKTTWFQDLWKAIWGKIGEPVKAAWAWIKETSSKVFNWLTSLPGKLKTAFAKVKDFISAPYKAAFNLIARAWNNTVGKLSFTLPDWVPFGMGGKGFSMPQLPTFHTGGIVPGTPGTPVPIMALAGERIASRSASGGGNVTVLRIEATDRRVGELLVELLRPAISKKGGNVQVVLGPRHA